MYEHVYTKAAELTARGESFAIATVVRVEGSSSAKPGSKALIDAHGKLILGWVGGGCAESAVRNEALQCIHLQQPAVITLDMTDELLGVGMPCGGKMDVYIEPVLPRPELLIVGHGRIAEAMCAFAHILGFRITINDPGAERSAFPQAEQLVTEDLDLSESVIGPNTYVVIATQHKNDQLALKKAIQGEAAYIALIASRHRSKLVLDYLAAQDVPEDKIAGIFAPAGFDLGAVTPEEIALSVVSQIVARRRGKQGQELTEARIETTPRDRHSTDKVITRCDL